MSPDPAVEAARAEARREAGENDAALRRLADELREDR